MHIDLTCQTCQTPWTLRDEPRLLRQLACPTCDAAADLVACEDFASALEDLLAQLHRIHKTHALRLHVDSGQLPPAFKPAEI